MTENKTDRLDIVPMGQKLAYGAGHLANQLYPAATSVFMVILVLALNMDPFLAGLLAAIPRLLDAITDPIMGYISDNSQSRWGRRKPFILVGSVLSGLSFMLMWQLDTQDSQMYNFFFFLGVSIVFYLGYTIFATPLIGLGYEMSSDYNERTRLMAVSQWLGQFAWVIAPWIWVFVYSPTLYESAAQGARTLAVWTGVICLILGIMPALFCKEMELPKAPKSSGMSVKGLAANSREFITGIKQTLSCKPFLKLCGATFLVFNGFQTIGQFFYYIIIFYLFNGDTVAAGQWPAWYGTITSLATAFLVIPIVTYISQKIGKKNAFIVSTIISIVGYILKWWGFSPADPFLMFLPLPLIAFGIGGLFTLMMSMTADVCDLDELNNGTRREATFGAVYWWMVKLGTALAFLTSGAILSLVGFDRNATSQSIDTITNLRIADIIIPVVLGIMAIGMMWNYNVTKDSVNQTRAKLLARAEKSPAKEDLEDQDDKTKVRGEIPIITDL